MEEKIINKALVELNLCDKKIEVASEPIETTPVKVTVTKTQDCDFVAIGERIKYTVTIKNECGGVLENLKFKDELDPCVEFVEDSFRVGDEPARPEIIDGILVYEIEEIQPCHSLEITFEVTATEACCKGCTPPGERSAPPVVRRILPFNPAISGTGVSGARIYVQFPEGEIRQATVNGGNWGVLAPTLPRSGDVITVWQIEPGKEKSDVVTIIV